jgi:3D (Asp-Asp-Asp) domain-containing protein
MGRMRRLLTVTTLASSLCATTLLASASETNAGITGIGVGLASVVSWELRVRRPIARKTLYRVDFSHASAERVVSAGREGIRVVVFRLWRDGDGPIVRHVVGSYVELASKPRVVAIGVGVRTSLDAFGRRALAKFGVAARTRMDMIATAYTPYCSDGCGGYTATGLPAGPGKVAVDPSVIPLGTRLYIPGYGFAIAADTGGAIRGNRIDLGFSSADDALRFGRQHITVYTLK